MVRLGTEDALDGSCLLHLGADGGESSGEVIKGRCECSACVSDREGTELQPSSIFLEGRDEGGAFLGLLRECDVAAEVRSKADLDYDNGALFLAEGGRVWRGGVLSPPRVY